MRKGEIACNKQFLLLSQCFLSYMALIFHFKRILKCRLQFVSFWTSIKILSSGNGIKIECIIMQNLMGENSPLPQNSDFQPFSKQALVFTCLQ